VNPLGRKSIRFQAITFGVDRDDNGVTVGFEMDRRPGHDSRGLIVSRGRPAHYEKEDEVYVEFGEPQQYCMYGGIESAHSRPGNFRIQFTDKGTQEMGGFEVIEVDYEHPSKTAPEILQALEYIFEGFDAYGSEKEPGASPG
jgi:hypothetical protein